MLVRLCMLAWLGFGWLFAQTATKNDDRIYDQVRQKLALDRDVRGGAIEVDVKDGVVTLRGAVREDKQKTKAEKVAKKVKGVNRVVNQLDVKPTAP
jgi:osmotically-inducible protein OsmY